MKFQMMLIAVRTDLPEDIKHKIYQILSDYMATEEGSCCNG